MSDLMRGSFQGTDPGAGAGLARDEKNAGTFVEFYFNEFTQRDHCRMEFPGNKLTVWDQPVREKDKQLYRPQWQAYKEGKSRFSGQTMLENWGQMDRGSVPVYKSMHINTVEHLAMLPDVNLKDFPPGFGGTARRHREMAQEFLARKEKEAISADAMEAARQSQAVAEQAIAEAQALREQVAAMQSEPAAQADYPRHAGGPWYYLSNGEKVKGKDAAHEAEEVLKAA